MKTNSKIKKDLGTLKSINDEASANLLQQQAFTNSLQANIISGVSSGKILMVNRAACKLLGYAKNELLTKTRASIFDISETSFKKMLKEIKEEGHSIAQVTVIKKNGQKIPCEITSADFTGEHGIEQSIVTIADRSKSILLQKNIDAKKEKTVNNDIAIAKTKQKKIDAKNEKTVNDDIAVAKTKQKKIDAKKEKIVSDDIAVAKTKQKRIDAVNKKVVADNIILAKLKQKGIDIEKEKIVAKNIIIAMAQSDARLAENTEWIKYIAKASYDVMWDWNIETDQIYVGDSEEEVFGYRVQNNSINFKNFIKCLVPEEKKSVEKNIREALATGKKSWKDSFMFRRKDGSNADAVSRASIVRNKTGKAIYMIGAIQDVSRVQELERNLEVEHKLHGEDRERFIEVAKLSFDIIWDWNIETGEVFRGEGFEKLLGFPLKIYKGNISDWNNHIHPDDKVGVEKEMHDIIVSQALNCEYAFRFIRADGTVANVFNRASILRDADGRARRMIGVMHDLSWQKELEAKLEKEIATKEKVMAEYAENFRLIFNSATDVLFDHDLITNIVLISDAYKKQFGYQVVNNTTSAEDWLSRIYPDDKAALFLDFKRATEAEDIEWKYSYRFLRVDNSVVNVTTTAIILRDVTGKAYRLFGSMHDDSNQQVLEEKLEQDIKLKEKQIADAIEDAKNTERADIGKELHDNINQLLGASKLYIDMAKQGGENSKIYLSESSKYTLEAIEEIRKLTRGLTTDIIKNLGLCEAIENISLQTMEVNPLKITSLLTSFKEDSVHDKFKLNIYRIVQEQLNNILKHAQASKVKINLLQNSKTIMLSISDNGEGFDTGKKKDGIGIANIKSRAATYHGNASFLSKPGQGCLLQVKFPVSEALLNRR